MRKLFGIAILLSLICFVPPVPAEYALTEVVSQAQLQAAQAEIDANAAAIVVLDAEAGSNTVNTAANTASINSNITNIATIEADTYNAAVQTNFAEYFTLPFISTNDAYQITWFGPFSNNLELVSMVGQTDAGTQEVYLIEKAFATGWFASPAATNNYIVLDDDGATDTTFADSTLEAGNMLGIRLENFDSTQGVTTVTARRTTAY